MKILFSLATAFGMIASLSSPAAAQAPEFDIKPGERAPGFTVYDSRGERQSLEQYAGSYLVLEWTNLSCPEVDLRYETGYLQALQKTYTDRSVVWLSVISSASGRQGNAPRERMNSMLQKRGARQTAVLLDGEGVMGRAYGARVTPQAFVIDPEGIVIYAGALDDQPKANEDTLPNAVNYVSLALEDALAGRRVTIPRTEPFGCDVRYARQKGNR